MAALGPGSGPVARSRWNKLTEGTEGPTDEDLVRQTLQGDGAAFELLYGRYFPRVYRFVDRRVANRADAEEIVQEAFFNLFSALGSFRGDAPFGAWVFGVTRRTLAARFKRKRHDTVPLPDEDVWSGAGQKSDSNPLDDYEYNDRLRRMSVAARRDLSPEQWTLFRLHHLEDHSIQEIASMVDKSEDSVKSHLYRARRLLLAR